MERTLRIAVSGTHGVGKSTLVETLSLRLPHHQIVEESYYVLDDAGYEFSTPPSVDEFKLLFRHELKALRRRQQNVIFDRCPLDYLGYLFALSEIDSFDLDRWQPTIRRAIGSLDLLVFIPVTPEADALIPRAAYQDLRSAVDDVLREIILDDRFGFCGDVAILDLVGPVHSRAERVMNWLPSA
ncbi:MAG: AAA family ATPase [Dehalococcoidia bacterium]|nr:AAA family ATPase [Dehalococcoidia bacterium]